MVAQAAVQQTAQPAGRAATQIAHHAADILQTHSQALKQASYNVPTYDGGPPASFNTNTSDIYSSSVMTPSVDSTIITPSSTASSMTSPTSEYSATSASQNQALLLEPVIETDMMFKKDFVVDTPPLILDSEAATAHIAFTSMNDPMSTPASTLVTPIEEAPHASDVIHTHESEPEPTIVSPFETTPIESTMSPLAESIIADSIKTAHSPPPTRLPHELIMESAPTMPSTLESTPTTPRETDLKTGVTIDTSIKTDSSILIEDALHLTTKSAETSPPPSSSTLSTTSSPLPKPVTTPPPPPTITTKASNPPQGTASLSVEDSVSQPIRFREGRAVPATRVGRAFGFAQLGLGLAMGTVGEGLSRLMGRSSGTTSRSLVVNDGNADLLASTLCRMRGAALKLGQMLSIQDAALLPEPLVRALEQVRQGADAMPKYQLFQQMEKQFGLGWRTRFESFEDMPFAAASIGQVHRATILHNGQVKPVVVKVQYPGVANSIESDLRNLSMLVTWSGMAPKGLFLENVLSVGQEELKVECDYLREMRNQWRVKDLVDADEFMQENKFRVPKVYEEWTTAEVITSEYCSGGTIDKAANMSQEERNRIARAILYLTVQELFVWRFMQTDPNWGNFLYDTNTQTTSLIDFGAAREYSKDFVDGYLRIVWASANRDEETLMSQSLRMKFLTGQENETMMSAHKMSGFVVGEPFATNEPYDFRGSNISARMSQYSSVFVNHRLTPPPEEVYTLHRKLAGAYMLCIRLGAVIPCRDVLEEVVSQHKFDDGMSPPVMP
jgi:aarF domain-containing kinase